MREGASGTSPAPPGGPRGRGAGRPRARGEEERKSRRVVERETGGRGAGPRTPPVGAPRATTTTTTMSFVASPPAAAPAPSRLESCDVEALADEDALSSAAAARASTHACVEGASTALVSVILLSSFFFVF